jgi:hypothetical protein
MNLVDVISGKPGRYRATSFGSDVSGYGYGWLLVITGTATLDTGHRVEYR